ncbi:MAG: hypothetical protein Q9227_009215, partial [Pyrenula ochraceoflavens]
KDYRELQQKSKGSAPRYAILSHRWYDEEIKLEDLPSLHQLRGDKLAPKMPSAKKVEMFCKTAQQRGYSYAWMDTCCIAQRDPAELSTAINSMYSWYKDAAACFVYLSDFDSRGYLSHRDEEGNEQVLECTNPTQSCWFTRGWTLQELVASKNVEFFDRNWIPIGNKTSEKAAFEKTKKIGVQDVSNVTGIDRRVLMGHQPVGAMSIANRMSWFHNRTTTVPEDSAYCLLGIFGVNMPLLYGEGSERAFHRLQEEIMKYSDDHSLFAWLSPTGEGYNPTGLLAPSPKCFKDSGAFYHQPTPQSNSPFAMTNKGLNIDLRLMRYQDKDIATLDCGGLENGRHLSIWLRCVSEVTNQYVRIDSDRFCLINQPGGSKRIFYTVEITPANTLMPTQYSQEVSKLKRICQVTMSEEVHNKSFNDFAPSVLPLYLGPLVTVRIGSSSHECKLSKPLICKQSPYFKATFESGFQEGKEQSTTLEEVDGVVSTRSFQMLVQWLYRGRVVLGDMTPTDSISAIIEFVRIADMFGVTGMESIMAEQIKTTLLASSKSFLGGGNSNTQCLESSHIVSAASLPEGHPVRRVLASAVAGEMLRTDKHKFAKEAKEVGAFAADLLEAVMDTLESHSLMGGGGVSVRDPLSGEERRLRKG